MGKTKLNKKSFMSEKQASMVRDYWDKHSKEWLKDYEERNTYQTYYLNYRKRLVIEAINGEKGRVLDLGCGPAAITKDLLVKGFEVWGIDVSSEMIKLAYQNIKEMKEKHRAHFSIGDINHLEFKDNFFDIVICVGVFPYLTNPDPALKEIVRVLKDDGTVVITVVTKRVVVDLIRSFLAKVLSFFPDGNKICEKLKIMPFSFRRYRPWEFNRLLNRYNLKICDATSFSFIFFPIGKLFSNMSMLICRKLDRKLKNCKTLGWLGKSYLVKAKASKSM